VPLGDGENWVYRRGEVDLFVSGNVARSWMCPRWSENLEDQS
jgi:hypothetical protein